jgi:hypothetical protein
MTLKKTQKNQTIHHHQFCFMMNEVQCNIHQKHPQTLHLNKNANKFHVMEHQKFQPKDNYLWISDSGASCHFTNDDTGMFILF